MDRETRLRGRVAMTSGAEHPVPAPARWARRVSRDERARAKGTRLIGDGSFYVREELFAEPGELEEFLEYVQSRGGQGRRRGRGVGRTRYGCRVEASQGQLSARLLAQSASSAPCITFVTLGELTESTIARSWGRRTVEVMESWTATVPVLGYDDAVARTWGRLSAETRRAGRVRPVNDMWKASPPVPGRRLGRTASPRPVPPSMRSPAGPGGCPGSRRVRRRPAAANRPARPG